MRLGDAVYDACMRNIGLPELLFVAFGILTVVLMLGFIVAVNVLRGRGHPWVGGRRLCTSCGRALVQPREARFCAFCGKQIP